jgi:hypothetical protein
MKDAPQCHTFTIKMTVQIRQMQEEVTSLNEVGSDLFQLGKLESAAFHFSHALQRVKQIAIAKKSALLGDTSAGASPVYLYG